MDDVDLFIGGVSERPVEGAVLGPAFLFLLGDQAIHSEVLMDADLLRVSHLLLLHQISIIDQRTIGQPPLSGSRTHFVR